MKLLKACTLAFMISFLPYGARAESLTSQQTTPNYAGGNIDTQQLEALLISKTPLTLLDARSDKWFDGVLIAGAQRLPSDTPQDIIEQTLPNKNHLIVVYCGGGECPASKNLANRLSKLGYTNVLDYHGGITEWVAQNKPTQKG